MNPPKLITIGIDSADVTLVRRWAHEGYLPTLSRLLRSGVTSSVRTPVGVLEGAIWPTFLTSTSAASHGMFTYSKIKPGTYDMTEAMRADRLPVPFWMELSHAGNRLAVIDAPFARPLKLNGIQVTNWGAHDPWSWERSSWPLSLITELVERFGDHPVANCDARNRTIHDYEDLRTALIRGVRKKTDLLQYCMGIEDWNFFFGVFSESHCVGHQFWHLMDASNPRHNPKASALLRSAIRDVYVTIDEGLARILTDVSPATNVLIVLSHGMGPYYHGSHLLDEVIERLGVNDGPNPGWSSLADEAAASYSRAWHKIWDFRCLLPTGLRNRLKERLPIELLNSLWLKTHPELHPWSTKRAFQLPDSNMTGLIRINLKGREPSGLVAPGSEYETLCKELKDSLMALENPDTGRRAVQWVACAEELYQGPRLNELPDLFVEWDHSAPITSLCSAQIGTVHGVAQADRTGSHWPNGLLVGIGPDFTQGEVQELRTVDIGPTILDFFGVTTPKHYEGTSHLPLLKRQGLRAA